MDVSQYEGSFAGRYAQDFEELGKRIAKPRILVSGGTGAGKSTLVNLLFKREIAAAGSGRPVTRGIAEYQNEQCIIYDTEGYETGSQNQEAFKRLVFGFLDERAADPATAVNAVWYCISAPSARVLDVDAAFVREARARGIPVACVLTQVDCATFEQCEAVKFELRRQLASPAIFLSSIDEELMRQLDDGLDALFAWTKKALPEAVRLAFVTAANRDIAGKAEEGVKIIRQHCMAAFATGFTPIPASDAPLLIAQQTAPVARLTYLWRIADLKDLISSPVIRSTMYECPVWGLSPTIIRVTDAPRKFAVGSSFIRCPDSSQTDSQMDGPQSFLVSSFVSERRLLILSLSCVNWDIRLLMSLISSISRFSVDFFFRLMSCIDVTMIPITRFRKM